MPAKPRTRTTGGDTEKKRKRDEVDDGGSKLKKSKAIRAKRARIANKATKKKTPFYGITRTAKAKGEGLTPKQYDVKTMVSKFRRLQANGYLREKAKGEKDVKKRNNAMKDAWAHANKLARDKYTKIMIENDIDPMTFKKKKR